MWWETEWAIGGIMTPNEIITIAKKRLKNFSSSIDWDTLYGIVIDDIFTRKQWKFAQGELNYIHFQSTFDKEFKDTAAEKALMKIKSVRVSTNYAPGPIPLGNIGRPLEYIPMQRFMSLYPDHNIEGIPYCFTEITGGDGTNGMHIGLYYVPNSDVAVWVIGDFIPAYVINDNPMPILPLQFHRIVSFGLIMHGADEAGQDKLSARAERWYETGLARMDTWDIKNGVYHMKRLSDEGDGYFRTGPFFPENYPRFRGR